jgi:CO/xanthine dehydrogenase FAD-binding subunit
VRGTVGGSLAHADPAAELAVVAATLEAEVVARSAAGARTIAAADFFLGPYTTSLRPEELVVEVKFPAPPPGASAAFEELAERAGDFALASVCAAVARSGGRVTWARIGLGSVGPTPLRAFEAERALVDGADVAEAAALAARECDPASDSHASSDYRRELVSVLTRRALERALA